jgi:D-cysteine desulfhydrase family pyridoxal phosphate-dependent enzyme
MPVDKRLKEELAQKISSLPRVRLGNIPTPLEDAPRFLEALRGPRILIKRDDLTGLAFGGNKVRKLEFFLGEAKAQGCDVVISGGGVAQSNHARQSAAAACKLGMKPVLVLRGGGQHQEPQGNFLLDRILGADVRFYSAEEIKARGGRLVDFMDDVAEEYRRKGHKPYAIKGSSLPVGTVGYVECALELASQLDERGIKADRVFATSYGGTQAGLILGAKFLKTGWKVVGVSPSKGRSEERSFVAELVNETAKLIGIETRVMPDDVENFSHEYVGEAYGLVTEAGREAIYLLARTEGIFLDPVYTGKGMSGLIDQVRRGRIGKDETVVFVHTGGLPAIFAYAEELAVAVG